jgi:hypothetical protein
MVFLRQEISQDDDLHIVMGQACLQQRDIFHDRIVLAITAMSLQSLEGRAPMIRHAPLRLIAGGHDGKINRPVNQSDAGTARAAGAFSNDIQQAMCDDGTCFLLAAARQHLLFTIDIGFDGAPFRCNLSGDRFGFHPEYRRRFVIVLRLSVVSHCLR